MTEMISLHAIDSDGTEHALTAPAGSVLMELLRDAGLDVEAVCGGCCACATCHVYVDHQAFGERGELEEALVGSCEHFAADRSRLSCQLTLSPEHNGLTVVVAPEE